MYATAPTETRASSSSASRAWASMCASTTTRAVRRWSTCSEQVRSGAGGDGGGGAGGAGGVGVVCSGGGGGGRARPDFQQQLSQGFNRISKSRTSIHLKCSQCLGDALTKSILNNYQDYLEKIALMAIFAQP